MEDYLRSLSDNTIASIYTFFFLHSSISQGFHYFQYFSGTQTHSNLHLANINFLPSQKHLCFQRGYSKHMQASDQFPVLLPSVLHEHTFKYQLTFCTSCTHIYQLFTINKLWFKGSCQFKRQIITTVPRANLDQAQANLEQTSFNDR